MAGAILYVDGHGMHLAADSIREEGLTGDADRVAYFWDEQLSHWELHGGLILFVIAFCAAEVGAPGRIHSSLWTTGAVAAVLGTTLFASTVEGGTWWLLPPVAILLGTWARARSLPLLRASSAAFALATLLLLAWAAWHDGVPEFSELGWI
jgi:hypothetical protein